MLTLLGLSSGGGVSNAIDKERGNRVEVHWYVTGGPIFTQLCHVFHDLQVTHACSQHGPLEFHAMGPVKLSSKPQLNKLMTLAASTAAFEGLPGLMEAVPLSS